MQISESVTPEITTPPIGRNKVSQEIRTFFHATGNTYHIASLSVAAKNMDHEKTDAHFKWYRLGGYHQSIDRCRDYIAALAQYDKRLLILNKINITRHPQKGYHMVLDVGVREDI